MTAERIALLGAALEPTRVAEHGFGPWHFAWTDGAVRSIRANGVEVLRGIEFLSRDPNWGVHALLPAGESVETEPGRLVLRYAARSAEGAPRMSLELEVIADATELRVSASAVAEDAVATARTGFVVLHPIEGFAGTSVEAGLHGERGRSVRMPELVSPAQPLRDFDHLALGVPGGGALEIDFEADVPFEMEDQRNWTDASFKTYVRPLSLPWPYRIEAGERVEQTIRLRLTGAGSATAAATGEKGAVVLRGPLPAPERGLVWLAADPGPNDTEALAALRPERLEAHVDLRRPDAEARAGEAAALAGRLGAALHLRLILPDEGDVLGALAKVAARAARVASVLALPAAFLKSYQPDGQWPETRSPADALAVAREAFPGVGTAEGMLTFFTEFNRHPPGSGAGAVTFGTSAIVHAADDISVMETIEALPSVFASARAHAGGRPVDVALAAIALWTNPYGAATVPNPGWNRTPLSDRDPRIRGLFGAAWLAAYHAHAVEAGIRSVGLGTVSGPLGILPGQEDDEWRGAMPDARVRPVWHVAAALGVLGPELAVRAPCRRGQPAVIAGNERALIANTAAEPVVVPLAGHRIRAARILDAAALPAALADPDWFAAPGTPQAGPLELGPYAVALATLEET